MTDGDLSAAPAGVRDGVIDLLDPRTKALVTQVLAGTGHAEFAIARVRAAIQADPRVAEREPLARLLAGASASQLGDIGRMFAALATRTPSGWPPWAWLTDDPLAQPNPTRRASPMPNST